MAQLILEVSLNIIVFLVSNKTELSYPFWITHPTTGALSKRDVIKNLLQYDQNMTITVILQMFEKFLVYGKYVSFDIWVVHLLWDPPIIFLNLVILKINIQGETSLRADFVSFRLFPLHRPCYLYLT